MNGWLLAAGVLMVGAVAPSLWLAASGEIARRMVGLQLLSASVILVFLLLAQGFGQPAYLIVPLALAVLSFAGTLVFVRLLRLR